MSGIVEEQHAAGTASAASAAPRRNGRTRRLLVLHNEDCLLHETVELLGSSLVPAYESPQRLRVIWEALQSNTDIVEFAERRSLAQERVLEALEQSHDKDYIRHLRSIHAKWVSEGLIEGDGHVLPECFRVPSAHLQLHRQCAPQPVDPFALSGFYAFDMSTGISKDTWTAVVASASLALDSVRVMLSERRDVVALCRPPGHHCTTKMAGGYCYVNNVVVAVTELRSKLQDNEDRADPKIAILDLDFHHGNGTQDYFYQDSKVLYVSVHGENEYPYYTGFTHEVGFGAGEGLNLNLPLRTGASADEYLEQVDTAVAKIAGFSPDFLFVSLGFDTYKGDPLGYFMIETDDYERIARRVRHESSGMSDVLAVLLLEGGYVVDCLGDNMTSFLRGWEAVGACQGMRQLK